MAGARELRDNLVMNTFSRHHVITINWVRIDVRTSTPIAEEEARRIALRSYLEMARSQLATGSPVPGWTDHADLPAVRALRAH